MKTGRLAQEYQLKVIVGDVEDVGRVWRAPAGAVVATVMVW
jgi:hypothetical protein